MSTTNNDVTIAQQIERLHQATPHVDVTIYSSHHNISVHLPSNIRLRRHNGWYSVQCPGLPCPPGLTPVQIDMIRKDSGPSPSSCDDCCPICIDEFRDSDQPLKMLPCSHRYHSRCIDRWLEGSVVCPTCRFDVREYLINKIGWIEIVHAQV